MIGFRIIGKNIRKWQRGIIIVLDSSSECPIYLPGFNPSTTNLPNPCETSATFSDDYKQQYEQEYLNMRWTPGTKKIIR